MNVILIGHGHTAAAMKEAAEMIFGSLPTFHPLSFVAGEGFDSLTEKLRTTITDNGLDSEDTLIVADLFGGSPYNAAAGLALRGEVKDVVAGMSVPMCLILAQGAAKWDVAKAVGQITKQAPLFTRTLSAELLKKNDESDF
ncbi:MAG: hypothetical protein WAX29_06455 [Propionibacterium sp.]